MLKRVAVVSIAPILPGAVHGGSQRILDGVLRGLADAGAEVRALCSWRPENDGGFELATGVSVEPLLRLSGYFPDPWEVAPHQILQSAEAIAPVLEWSESVYLHADTFYLRGLIPDGRRVIRSFHDFHYETALVSAFGFDADLTIVPSGYLKRCIDATVGSVPGREDQSVKVVPNGIDLTVYRPLPGVTPRGVRERTEEDLVLLWPHRPDPRKGIKEAINIAAGIKSRFSQRKVRLLVPRHVDAASSAETRAFYDAAVDTAIGAGVMDSLEFTPWWDGEETPAAYNFADVTLCPGNFIESFSLAAYESIACGTPVVAAAVGALRDLEQVPDAYVFPWADTDAAVRATEAAVRNHPDVEDVKNVLASRFSFGDMQAGYVEAITGDLSPQLAANARTRDRFMLAPWCTVTGDRVYHDYRYGCMERPEIAGFLSSLGSEVAGGNGFARAEAVEAGVSDSEIDQALEDGVLVRTHNAS